MGYMIVLGSCYSCRRPFTFNPERVPSVRVNAEGVEDPAGVRQPICLECIDAANPIRVANGLNPLVPHPDAYEATEDW